MEEHHGQGHVLISQVLALSAVTLTPRVNVTTLGFLHYYHQDRPLLPSSLSISSCLLEIHRLAGGLSNSAHWNADSLAPFPPLVTMRMCPGQAPEAILRLP